MAHLNKDLQDMMQPSSLMQGDDILNTALDAVVQSDGSFAITQTIFDAPASIHGVPSFQGTATSTDIDQSVGGAPMQLSDYQKPRQRTTSPSTTAPKTAVQSTKQRVVSRESQRRFRDRQKNVISELESQLESVKLAVEQQKAENQALNDENALMTNLMNYKGDFVKILEDNAKARSERTIEDRIFPESLQMMREFDVRGEGYSLETLDAMLRYAPAGYTAHLRSDIFAIKDPPLSAYIEQWRITTMDFRNLLAEAKKAADLETAPSTDSEATADLATMLLNVHLEDEAKTGQVLPAMHPPQEEEMDVFEAGSVNLEYNGIRYIVNKELMARIVAAFRPIINQLWSMTVCFPDSAMQFSNINMETGEPAGASQEYNDVDRWSNVLKLVGLRQEQLELMASLHYQYLSIVRPVLRERATIMQHLLQAASRQTDSIKDHIEATADLGDCTSALAEIVRKEYVAWTGLLGKYMMGVLDYPVQQMIFISSSYPYMPNLNLIGSAAALELGLDPFEYQFNESDFEKAPFLRPQELMRPRE